MKLLFVEDYPPLQKAIAKGLREANFSVDVTGEGKDGLWLATTGNYDVIILDLRLPGMDGMSILRELRARGHETHVLIVTSKDTVSDRVEGLDAGADDYLVKPFSFEELLARIHALIRRGYHRKNPLLQYGDLRIDTTSQRVWRGSEEIILTQREYALLEYLAMRADEVVSRTDIWEHIYDFNSSATSNVVDVYIGYLRKKIDRAGESSLIETVRGRGYTMRTEP